MKKKFARRKGFTLIELLVAIAIIAVLTGMGIRSYSSLMKRVKEASSQTNLAAINVALNMYKKDQGNFPPDGKGSDLYTALAEYEVGKTLFMNPYNGKNSENLYVNRTFDEQDKAFVLANPSTRKKETTVLLFGHEPQKLPLQEVTYGGNPIKPGETVTGGVMDFGGGTTVKADPGTKMMLIQSFELADGTPYGLVRVDDAGKVKVKVTPGWKFEVITPAAIAGVEGTQFIVKVIDKTETEIDVTKGKVWVTERTGKGKTIVTAGRTVRVKRGKPPISEDNGHHDNG
ncbi:MAG: prepilin-type N-terminal cleavage/methylation domain-containing protein [Nitrospirae bacterium]|nr:prepilin-type N-terminal cleavage/methylation domain-containing protein [Nitrospirota bacterium]